MEVVVTGIGLRSCLGSLDETWRQLLAGKSGIGWHQPFPQLPPHPLGLIAAAPASLPPLLQGAVRDALATARLAPPLPDCGVAIGSSRGFQSLWEQAAAQPFPSLENWLETLPHQGALLTARQVGSTGTTSAPMAACATGIWAIAQGFELIRQGRHPRVIVGAAEAPITPLTWVGFRQMGALAEAGCHPFDRHRQGLVLGEGAAVLVLESAELASSRGAPIYGRILGVGLTCDAAHVSAPPPDNGSAAMALRQCLHRSHLHPRDIDYIHAHGTGTVLNDRREAALIQSLFPREVPVSSTKGATGHTLGASGVLGAAFCLLALKHQELPPCVGLAEPEFESVNFVRAARQEEVRQVLCLSFGFGGQNAALALGR